MSDPDVPQRFLDLAKQAGRRHALSDASLRERFGEPGQTEIHIGQVWRARWDEASVLVLVLEVGNREVMAAPVTVDPPAEDDHCLIVDGSSTAFGVDATVWTALASPVPVRVLDRAIDMWSEEIAHWISTTTRGRSEPEPTGTRLGGGSESELDPVASIRADLADEVEELRRAPGLPADTSPTRSPNLASLLGPNLDLALLCSSLGMRQPEVMKLLRGKTQLTLEQVHIIAQVTGLSTEKVAETVRPLPLGLVVAAEHPRWRQAWADRARQHRVSEEEARLVASYGAFALAARETSSQEPDWDKRLRHFLSADELSPGGA